LLFLWISLSDSLAKVVNKVFILRIIVTTCIIISIDEKQLYGFVISSKIRLGILKVLFKNPTLRQSEIAKKIKQKQQNIYKSIGDLEKAGLIECLNPEKAWKSYIITENGKGVLQFGTNLEEETKKRNIKTS
jgi:DNA-binding MarR family transcriptional regulator